MKESTLIDVSAWSRFNKGPEAPLWWGILGLIAIETTVVGTFISTYLYFRATHAVWPPAGVAPPELFWPTINLILLLTSCYTMRQAGREISRERRGRFVLSLWASVTLASMVLVLRWQQFEAFDFRWDAHPYGSIVWTISGFHFVHVVSAVIGTAAVAVLGMKGYFNRERQLAVVVDTLYWYFVCFAWVPLYAVVYWVPRLT